MSKQTEFSTLELFQEGLKMWEWLTENPEENKDTYPVRCHTEEFIQWYRHQAQEKT